MAPLFMPGPWSVVGVLRGRPFNSHSSNQICMLFVGDCWCYAFPRGFLSRFFNFVSSYSCPSSTVEDIAWGATLLLDQRRLHYCPFRFSRPIMSYQEAEFQSVLFRWFIAYCTCIYSIVYSWKSLAPSTFLKRFSCACVWPDVLSRNTGIWWNLLEMEVRQGIPGIWA